jgi:hypothetical protein
MCPAQTSLPCHSPGPRARSPEENDLGWSPSSGRGGALVWHFDAAGKVDRVVNLSGDQHQMDAFIWANFPLKPLPECLAG